MDFGWIFNRVSATITATHPKVACNTKLMQKNVGTWDRIVRLVLGLILAYIGTTTSGAGAVILYILAIILILTGIFGTCLLYSIFKINTRKKGPPMPPTPPMQQ